MSKINKLNKNAEIEWLTADLNIDTTEYITHFRCFNKDKTKEHYLVNQFYRKPTADKKRCEIVLVKIE